MNKILFGISVFALGILAFSGQAYAAAPSVETLAADVISNTAVTLNGELNPEGRSTTFWFEYGTSRSDLDEETTRQSAGSFDAFIDVFHTIRGLDRDTTYFFRLVARNSDGTERGDIRSFRTGSGSTNDRDPDVTTGSAQVNFRSVTLNGDVDPNGNWVQVWFRYGTNRNSLTESTSMLTMFGDSSKFFSRQISNIVPGVTYFYQAVAQNANGTDSGQILSFNSSGSGGPVTGDAPIVLTDAATVLGQSSAMLRAQVNPNGHLSSVWFEYGRTTALGGATTRDPAGSGGVLTSYAATLSGLAPGTTYFYRAAVQSPFGTNRGQILSFTTLGAPVTGGPGLVQPPAPAPAPTPTAPTGAPGCFALTPALNAPQFNANDDFTYSVTYRNDCGYALGNTSLEITLPLAVDFAGTNFPFLSRDGNVITYNLGSVAQSFQATVTVNGKIKAQVNAGDMLIFQADMTFTDPRGNLQNASAYLTAAIAAGAAPEGASTSTLGANILDALGGLFTSGWFWLVLFLILIALFVFWLATRRRSDEDEEEAVEMAH